MVRVIQPDTTKTQAIQSLEDAARTGQIRIEGEFSRTTVLVLHLFNLQFLSNRKKLVTT